MTETEEFEFRSRLEAESAAPQQRLSPLAQSGLRLTSGLIRGGPMGLAAEGTGIGWEGLEKLAETGGGKTVDVLAKVAPPEVAAATGTLVNMAPTLAGGFLAPAAGGRQLMDTGAKKLMQQAVRPSSKSLANGEAAKAIDTMLAEGIPATTGGAAKLRQMVTALKREVGQRISQSGEMVDRKYAYRELAGLLDDVSQKGTGYKADQKAVLKAWNDFKNHPLLAKFAEEGDLITMQAADKMKRASQKAAELAYGALTPPTTFDMAQQAIARGLKKGMNAADEVVAAMNAKISEYMTALEVLEPRVAQAANTQMAGIAPVAQSAEGAMLMLADRNPWLKSYVAHVLHGARNTAPFAAGATAAEVHKTK